MFTHPGVWDKPIPDINYLWRNRTSTQNNLEKSRLVCVLCLFFTFIHSNEENNQSSHWVRDDGIGKSCRGLQILDTWVWFPSPSLNVVFDAKQKYRGMFETQKSGNKTSSGKIGPEIRTHASPEVGQDQVFGGVNAIWMFYHYHLISLYNTYFHWLKCSLPGKVIPPCTTFPKVRTKQRQ